MPTILPSMSNAEMLEVTKVYSVAGLLPRRQPLVRHRPFRAPHHTISHAGLVGGGRIPRPGEITLAHRSVLFLDELPEYNSQALETLRQPLEDRVVTISRASGTLSFPANFILIGAMNPCPCGFSGDPVKECTCPNCLYFITNAETRKETIPKDDWKPAYLIIDEAQEVMDDLKTPELIALAREFKLGVTVAHQQIKGQLSDALFSTLSANTRIKYAGTRFHQDASIMARDMRCAPDLSLNRRLPSPKLTSPAL